MPQNNLCQNHYPTALFLAFLTLIISAFQISDGHHWRGDFAAYVSQAIALSQGNVAEYIAQNSIYMDKSDWVVGPHSAPWGLPLILAIPYKIFGFNLVAFKSVGIICYGLFVGIFYIFCANRIPKIYALFAALFFALNPHTTLFSASEIVCDIPFLLISFIALVVLAKLFGEIPPTLAERDKVGGFYFIKNKGIFIATLGGILLFFATLIRFNGIIILCALVAMQGILLLKKNFAQIFHLRILRQILSVNSPYSWKIHAIPYVVFIIAFVLISFILSSGTSGYMREFDGVSLPQSIAKNLYHYGVLYFGDFFGNSIVLFVLFIPLIALGIATNLSQNAHHSTSDSNFINPSQWLFFIIFWVGFFAHLVLWPPLQGLRYAYPLLPFMVFFGVCGLRKVCESRRIGGRIMALLCTLIIVNNTLFCVRQMLFIHTDSSADNAYSVDSQNLYRFITANTAKEAIIISFRPRVIYLNTARWGFATNNIERIKEADFVLWSVGYDFYKMPSVESNAFKAQTKLIYANREFKLFKVLK